MGELFRDMQKQQCEVFKHLKDELKAENINTVKANVSLEIARLNEANKAELQRVQSTVDQTDHRHVQRATEARVDECIKQYEDKHNAGPYASFLPRKQLEADGLMLAQAASEDRMSYGGRYDPQAAQRDRATDQPMGTPKNSTMMQSGYLPSRFQVPKHEEAAAGLFHGGEEARTKWPDYHANFEHVATSYGWGYEMRGAILNRKSRDHALQVIKSIEEEDRMDYDHLVRAFNNAYIPSEWARAYRGNLNSRTQKEGESFLQFAAALRKLATIAYPSTDKANTDKVREERCLDVFLNGIKTPHVAVFITNRAPKTMEEAVSAAEVYAAVWARKDILPVHPDLVPVPDTTQAAMVPPPAGNPRQPGAKPFGQKPYPKKNEGYVKKASNGADKSKSWENPQSEMIKMMKQMLEEMCKNVPQKDSTQRSQGFHKDQKGRYNKPAFNKYKDDSPQPRCYRCQKVGHILRNCRVNIGAVDECCVAEWYCEDHDPEASTKDEDF